MGVVEAFERATAALIQEEQFDDVEIVRQTARRTGSITELRLMLDRPGGVDLALCGQVAKWLNASLRDETAPYTLEVESAGLERPLIRLEDYERFQGRLVCIRTFDLLEGAKTHRGQLEGVRGEHILLIEEKKKEKLIPLPAIKEAHLEFDLRAALHAAKSRSAVNRPSTSKRERRP